MLDFERNFFLLSLAGTHSKLQRMLLTPMSITPLFHSSPWLSLSQSFANSCAGARHPCLLSPSSTVLRTVKTDTSPKVIKSLKVGPTLSWCAAARHAEQAVTVPKAQPCFISLSSLQAIIVYFAVSNACNFNPANSFHFTISGRRMGVLLGGQLCLYSRTVILHLQISPRSASHTIFLHFPHREASQLPKKLLLYHCQWFSS